MSFPSCQPCFLLQRVPLLKRFCDFAGTLLHQSCKGTLKPLNQLKPEFKRGAVTFVSLAAVVVVSKMVVVVVGRVVVVSLAASHLASPYNHKGKVDQVIPPRTGLPPVRFYRATGQLTPSPNRSNRRAMLTQ